MRHVSRAALYHPSCCIEVHPQEKTKKRQLEVVTNLLIGQNSEYLLDAKNCLADGFNMSVLSLKIRQRMLICFTSDI